MKRIFCLLLITAVTLPYQVYAKGFSLRSRPVRSHPGAAIFRPSTPPKTAPNLVTPMRKAPTATPTRSGEPVRPTSTPSTSSASPQAAPAAGSANAASTQPSGSPLKSAIAPALIGAGAGYMASSLMNSHGQGTSQTAGQVAVPQASQRLAAETLVQRAVVLESPIDLGGQTCTKKALTAKGDAVYLNDANEICGVFAVPIVN